MTQLQHRVDAQAEKLAKETRILSATLERHSPLNDHQEAALITAQAKRVRNASQELIRRLATLRDNLDD